MAEKLRGCGWRKIGGLYLVGDGATLFCDLLPFPLDVCPCCGAGIKPTRGFTWLSTDFFKNVECGYSCGSGAGCPIINPGKEPLGLLWIGEQFYPTPEDFTREAVRQGVSRRIAQIPKNLKLGETWVLLAHRKACKTDEGYKPGIFYLFRPQRIEKILTEEMATPEETERLKRKGITPVIVDDDPRHYSADTLREMNKTAEFQFEGA